jgi:hypothetical protein
VKRHPAAADLDAQLTALSAAGVELIVVGGAAAVSGSGQINLSTSLGPLDPLCELEEGQGYDELYPHCEVVSDGELTLRVLDLPTLIRAKTKAGRAKDRMMLPILIATLEERGKSGH